MEIDSLISLEIMSFSHRPYLLSRANRGTWPSPSVSPFLPFRLTGWCPPYSIPRPVFLFTSYFHKLAHYRHQVGSCPAKINVRRRRKHCLRLCPALCSVHQGWEVVTGVQLPWVSSLDWGCSRHGLNKPTTSPLPFVLKSVSETTARK